MRRLFALGALALAATACDDPTSVPSPSPSPDASAVPINQSANPLDIAVIGDVPYGDGARAQFPAFVDAINADPKVRLVVHVGDIKSGSDLCSDGIFAYVADQFTRSADPLVYAIGDNEWTDCHRTSNGSYNPLERLAKVREVFFSDPGKTLGGRNLVVEAQDDYPENQLWVQSRVTFAALHVVGSNNGLEPWTAPLDDPAARTAEVTARNAANIAWLTHAFEVAQEQGSAGIALFFQADLWNPFDRAAGGVSFSGHTEFVNRLAQLAADFAGPVLLVSGDSHDLRVDSGVPWFSLYGAAPQPNITQVVVDRSLEDDANYLRLHVDPKTPGVFTWENVTVSLPVVPSASAGPVRFATFNASLNRGAGGQLAADLSTPGNAQASTVAEIIQRNHPDVLLINEFDFVAGGQAARLFQENYLSVSQNGAAPIAYPYVFVAPSNTGVPSGFDLDNDGTIGGGNDAFGFGVFPGQFGMAVYSKYPIDVSAVRTFQTFLWKDMPGALLPKGFYSPAEQDVLRLSSKSHWDLPIEIGGQTVHFLVSHPTPPVFDGPEDRNGRRNFDEIRFWADYVTPNRGDYIYDDEGRHGGLGPGEKFVIAGDLNSDPLDGDSRPGAAQQLLENPLINGRFVPESEGAVQQSQLQGGANLTHRSDPRFDTADFADNAPGNLRADYVLPSRGLHVLDGAVFWPLNTDPLFQLVGIFPFPSSDHRLVWVDLKVPGTSAAVASR